MSKITRGTENLFESLKGIATELIELISSFDTITINSVPFRNSWTAAQLADHVTKSNKAIIQAMCMEGKIAQRDAGERIEELKKMFLNYQTKFQAPGFLIPTQQVYEKKILIADLQTSIERLEASAREADFTEIINLPAFGAITKLELVCFVLYHTQRHIHQLRKIFISLENKKDITKQKLKKSLDK